MTGDRTAGRFDLASIDAVGLLGLQTEFAEGEVRAALRDALDAPLELLAILRTLWLQHFFTSPILAATRECYAFSRRRSLPLPPWLSLSVARRSEAIGSCSRISPLKIQTLTPQIPKAVSASAVP